MSKPRTTSAATSRSSSRPHRSRLRPALLLAVLLLVLAAVSVGCADSDITEIRVTSTAPGGATAPVAWEKVLDLGRAEIVNPDLSRLVRSDRHGYAAANNVLVVMEDGQGRAQAEELATQIGGSVVGEIEFINLYQIQTSGSTGEDLDEALDMAGSFAGVKRAVPNGLLFASAAIEGKPCSPLLDPAYDAGDNYIPYQMIGMMEAYAIIDASRAALNPVQVGVVDSPIYSESGQGLARELHFPDAAGTYPDSEVHVRGLNAGDIVDDPDPESKGGLSHGTQVTHVIAADWGDGVTGVASGLGERLTVSCSALDLENMVDLPADLDMDELMAVDLDQYAAGYYGEAFVRLIEQVEAGAKVINLSWTITPDRHHDGVEGMAVFQDFFIKMGQAHDDVLFVAAAGNESNPLDGYNYSPGGIANLPNLITVGALDRTGDRADARDWTERGKVSPEELQRWYNGDTIMRRIPQGMTFDEYMDKALAIGSNYATGDGEVTISVCGTDILVGRDKDGNPIVNDGTSFAAPQVTAAAAILKSINPRLKAEDIKELLVLTADTEVTMNGTTVDVPEGVGGCVLRVDEAVLQVINEMRDPDDQLIYGDLMELMTIELSAQEHEFGYLVTASTPRVETPEGVDLKIFLDGDAELFGEETHRIYNSLEAASWSVAPGPDPVKVTVRRLDNGACAFLELPGSDRWTSEPSGADASGGLRWVLVGEPVVNVDNVPIKYVNTEPRFNGTYTAYDPGETSFSVEDRYVDHEYEEYRVIITCKFDAPAAVLVPGESYVLTANFSHSGIVSGAANPGAAFCYECWTIGIENTDVLAYYPWSDNFDGVSSKTWTFTAPWTALPGEIMEFHAGWWNAPPCNVTWTYRAE